jgi:7-cyano-7-deazaguanine synthase|tara:strand:- start:194 stop:907 length:714 start_codon:yes stop_codon:yes gene_type:complete
MNQKTKRAVVLLSGGLDSATTLAMATNAGFSCYALSFDYGQRSSAELNGAKKVALAAGVVEHRILKIDLGQFGGSALTDHDIAVPQSEFTEGAEAETQPSEEIPITYVPARNTVFLSLALAWSEVLDSRDIFVGVNAVDYSGYPDCRGEYIEAFQNMANLATKAGVEGNRLTVHAPLIDLTKDEIIQVGVELGVDYGLTVSCYAALASGAACGRCDSCHIRKQGFVTAKVDDPTFYA